MPQRVSDKALRERYGIPRLTKRYLAKEGYTSKEAFLRGLRRRYEDEERLAEERVLEQGNSEERARVFNRIRQRRYQEKKREIREFLKQVLNEPVREVRETRNARKKSGKKTKGTWVRMVGSFVAIFEAQFQDTGNMERVAYRFEVDEFVPPNDKEGFARKMAKEHAQLWEEGMWSPKGRLAKYVDWANVIGINHLHLDPVPDKSIDRKAIRMREAFALDLDNHPAQVWDTNEGKCVIDALQFKYKGVRGMVSAIQTNSILAAFAEGGDYDSDGEDDPIDYLKDGVSTYEIERWCKRYRVPMYALDECNDIFCTYWPTERNKNAPSLVYRLLNGHMYLLDEKAARSVAHRGSDFQSTVFKKGEKNLSSDEMVYHEEVEDPLQLMASIMHEESKQVFPVKQNVSYADGELRAFTLNGTTHVINQQMENVKFLCERMGVEFQGQSLVSLLMEIVKQATGGKELPKSQLNPHALAVLTAEGVKGRTHVGCVNGYTEEQIQQLHEQGRLLVCDIRRCYTSCMYDAYDDFMVFSFNDEWKRYDGGELKRGLYYVKTDDYTLLHGNNVYSDQILKKAKEEGIQFAVKHAMVSSNKLGRDVMRSIIEKIKGYCEGNEDLMKFMCNMLSGYLGKTSKTVYDCHLSNNNEEVWEYMQKKLKENDKMFRDKVMVGDQPYYFYGKYNKVNFSEITLPFYIQIKDWANIRLYDMIKAMGGRLAYRKVDLAAVVDGQMPPMGAAWGSYRPSALPKHMGAQRGQSAEFVKLPEWNTHPVSDSDDWKKVKEIIDQKKGMLICGRAGVGKSHVIRKICAELGSGYKILAPTNKAALNVKGTTIHRFLKMDKDSMISLEWMKKIRNLYHTFIIDEISMIPAYLWRRLVELKRYTGAAFILVGDHRQCSPVEEEGLDHYFDHPAVKWLAKNQKVELTVAKRYDMELWDILEHVNGLDTSKYKAKELTKRNLCFTNYTRVRVNRMCNERWRPTAALRLPAVEKDEMTQPLWLHVGLPVIARVNKEGEAQAQGGAEEMELINNETYVVKAVGETVECETVRADEEGSPYTHTFSVPLSDFQEYFLMNYCSTTHKAQGETITDQYTIWDWEFMDTKLRYTSLSRAKSMNQVGFNSLARPSFLDRAVVEAKLSGHRDYDMKHKMEFNMGYEDVLKRFKAQGGMCCRCGIDLKTKNYAKNDPQQFSIDRVNEELGHTKGNVVLTCWGCNRMRLK